MRPKRLSLRCDIYCHVVDNLGDVGVCWRLARQLAVEYQWGVRLIIDQPEVLRRFVPQLDTSLSEQLASGITIKRWPSDDDSCMEEAADPTSEIPEVVIEAFGCRLPAQVVARMSRKNPAPVWINLEYLSAEPWIEDCHTLPSPHPTTGLTKYFFFPGFTKKSGGLLRERWVSSLVEEFDAPRRRDAFLTSLGITLKPGMIPVSLFCYPHAPINTLIEAWCRMSPAIHCLASEALPADILQKLHLAASTGAMHLSTLPFLPQDDFDRLLLSSEVNFVRGEDSFVRAQWATNPFVWQPYLQEENTHHQKLAAFLDEYLRPASNETTSAIRGLWETWNEVEKPHANAWSAFLTRTKEIREHNRKWASQCLSNGDLAANLAIFCESKL